MIKSLKLKPVEQEVGRTFQYSSINKDCLTKTLVAQEAKPVIDKPDLKTLKKFFIAVIRIPN